jgi:phenylpyruvate tautomerase PptA (4-oxalocrotonate tautomerase family)
MPKIIIHVPRDTFDARARQQVAESLTKLGLECEALPLSPFMKSAVWTYFNDYSAEAVFMGGQPANRTVISLQMYVIEGGLNDDGKRRLIRGATEILKRHSILEDPALVHIVIHEVPEINWGIFGDTANLAILRTSPIDAPAL